MTLPLRPSHAATLVVLALGLAACGLADPGPVAGDTTQVAPVLPGDAMVPEEITIVDALPPGTPVVEMAPDPDREPFAVFIQEAVVDGDRLLVSFNGGETPCFVVDHTETDETDDRVIVSVFVSVPDPRADCSQQPIFLQSVPIQLQAPLGDRPLEDGSRTVPDDARS